MRNLKKKRQAMALMANVIALVEQLDLLLSSISAVAAYLLAIGSLSYICAMSFMRRESNWHPPPRHW